MFQSRINRVLWICPCILLAGQACECTYPFEELSAVIDRTMVELFDLADADAYGDYQLGFNAGLVRATQIVFKNMS